MPLAGGGEHQAGVGGASSPGWWLTVGWLRSSSGSGCRHRPRGPPWRASATAAEPAGLRDCLECRARGPRVGRRRGATPGAQQAGGGRSRRRGRPRHATMLHALHRRRSTRNTAEDTDERQLADRPEEKTPVSTQSDLPVLIIGAGPIGLAAAAHAADRGLDRSSSSRPARGRRHGGGVVARAAVLRLVGARRPHRPPPPRGHRLDRARPGRATRPAASGARSTCSPWRTCSTRSRAAGPVRRPVTGVARHGRDASSTPAATATRSSCTSRTAARRGAARSPARSSTPRAPGPAPTRSARTATPRPASATTAARIIYGIPDFRDPAVAARVRGQARRASPARAPRPRGSWSASPSWPTEDRHTRVTWLLRRPSVGDAFGGGDNDQLEQRGALGQRAKAAAGGGHVTNVTAFRTESVTAQADGRLTLASVNGRRSTDVDEVIVVTGFRPDLSFLSEVRLDLDPALGRRRASSPSRSTRPPHLRRRRAARLPGAAPSPSRTSTWWG